MKQQQQFLLQRIEQLSNEIRDIKLTQTAIKQLGL